MLLNKFFDWIDNLDMIPMMLIYIVLLFVGLAIAIGLIGLILRLGIKLIAKTGVLFLVPPELYYFFTSEAAWKTEKHTLWLVIMISICVVCGLMILGLWSSYIATAVDWIKSHLPHNFKTRADRNFENDFAKQLAAFQEQHLGEKGRIIYDGNNFQFIPAG